MSSPEYNETSLPPGVPPEAAPFLQEVGYLQADRLRVGAESPRLVLTTLYEDAPVVIGALDAVLPTVLIFGSYT